MGESNEALVAMVREVVAKALRERDELKAKRASIDAAEAIVEARLQSARGFLSSLGADDAALGPNDAAGNDLPDKDDGEVILKLISEAALGLTPGDIATEFIRRGHPVGALPNPRKRIIEILKDLSDRGLAYRGSGGRYRAKKGRGT